MHFLFDFSPFLRASWEITTRTTPGAAAKRRVWVYVHEKKWWLHMCKSKMKGKWKFELEILLDVYYVLVLMP